MTHRDRRSGIQIFAFLVAIAGHGGIALAMIPAWVAKPVVSMGNPAVSIAVELVSTAGASSSISSAFPLDSAEQNIPQQESISAPQSVSNRMLDSNPIVGERDIAVSPPRPVKRVRKSGAHTGIATNSAPVSQANHHWKSDVARNSEGAANPASGNINPGYSNIPTDLPSDWKSKLMAQLERYKRYPDGSRERHEEGTSTLCFTLDRSGRVLDHFIAHSSGSEILDRAAETMIELASPLPALPADVDGDTLRLVVPVHFSLKK